MVREYPTIAETLHVLVEVDFLPWRDAEDHVPRVA